MEPQILKLKMVQGPREGEILEFGPGSTVRIGRVVRGNNLTIKDAGISSKHLVISFESEKWSVEDLDSSNGTAVNSTVLSPFESFDLHDGDTIKLGDSTSILVQIMTGEETSQLRRNTRRCVKESSKAGRVAQNRSRRGNAAAREIIETSEEGNVGKSEEEKVSNSEVIVVPQGRRRGRPGQARVLDKETEALGRVEEKMEAKRVNLRSTRSKTNEDSVDLENLVVDCSELGKREKAHPVRGKRKNPQEVPTEIANEELIEIVGQQVKAIAADQEKNETFGVKVKKEAVDLREEHRVNSSENLGKGKLLTDLEKMTVEQLSDSLEVDLPKQKTEAGSIAENPSREDNEAVRESIETLEEENVGKLEEKVPNSEVVMVPEGRRRGRPRNARVLNKETEVLGPAEERMESRKVNLRSTRSKKNDDSVVLGNLTVGCSELGRKEKGRGARGRRKNLQEVSTENARGDDVHDKENIMVKDTANEQEIEKEVAANQEKIGAVEDKVKKEPVDLEENYRDISNGTGVEERDANEAQVSSSENLGKGKQLPDLETMTLEQWFDTLKVDLPKQIIKDTEEMIEGIRSKAMRLKEYMMEQKKSMRAGIVG